MKMLRRAVFDFDCWGESSWCPGSGRDNRRARRRARAQERAAWRREWSV